MWLTVTMSEAQKGLSVLGVFPWGGGVVDRDSFVVPEPRIDYLTKVPLCYPSVISRYSHDFDGGDFCESFYR